MNVSNALLRACLIASVPIATVAQTEPVIVEAEDPTAVLGTTMDVDTDGTATYVTTTLNDTNQPSATNFAQKVGTYTVTFPAPGNYELYARYYIGAGGANDDSWYYGQGFNNSSVWSLMNLGQVGFNGAAQTVYPGGTVGSLAWRWVKVTGIAGQFPTVWTVPAGQLTQTFYWATREDGMLMDKFAFGRAGLLVHGERSRYRWSRDWPGSTAAAAGATSIHPRRRTTRHGSRTEIPRQRAQRRQFTQLRCVLESGDAGERWQVGQRRVHA